jgi:homoserine kinase type II
MAVPEEIAAILEQYDVGTGQSWQKIERGYVNEKWLVETPTGRYVLKRRHPSLCQPDLVAAQHALISHLHAVGFAAPEIVRTRRGGTSVRWNARMYELQKRIPGDPGDRLRPAHVCAAAWTLGHYHRLVSGFDRPVLHRLGPRYSPLVLTSTLERLNGECRRPITVETQPILNRLKEHARHLAEQLGQLENLPELVIHGDYYAGNILFRGDEIAGVVDYDQAHWSARAQEVAEATIYFAQEPGARFRHIVYSGVLDLDAVPRFLAAYADNVRLTGEEIRALPHLVRTIWLCASLDPPLAPRLMLDTDREALRESLALADWARAHARDIKHIGFRVFRGQNRR